MPAPSSLRQCVGAVGNIEAPSYHTLQITLGYPNSLLLVENPTENVRATVIVKFGQQDYPYPKLEVLAG
jgi:hypothetical protein